MGIGRQNVQRPLPPGWVTGARGGNPLRGFFEAVLKESIGQVREFSYGRPLSVAGISALRVRHFDIDDCWRYMVILIVSLWKIAESA
jgi:hypothetical protein